MNASQFSNHQHKTARNATFIYCVLTICAAVQVPIASNGAIGQVERYDYAGYRLSQWHRNSEAIVFYTAAIKADSSDFVAHFNRGCCYLEEERYAKALDDFNVALKLRPQEAGEIYGVRAIAWYQLGRDAECRADLTRAKPRSQLTHPSIEELWVNLCESSTHPAAEDVKRSVATVNRAVANARSTDDLAGALNRRAWFYAVCRSSTPAQITQAITDALEACRSTQFRNSNFLDTLAVAYARHGDYERAVETEKKAAAKAWHDQNSRSKYQQRLAIFKQHQPYYVNQTNR